MHLKRSPGIIRKSRVLYPGPRFLSSATWPSLPKKHFNGLNQTKASSKNKSDSSVEEVLTLCTDGFCPTAPKKCVNSDISKMC